MSLRNGKLSLAALSLTALGLMCVPGMVRAQDNPPGGDTGTPAADISNKKITLDVESANPYYALKLLFQQSKANFTLDDSLKGAIDSAHLHDVPFRVALETLLKSSGQPLTYTAENGITQVIPKKEEASPIVEGNPMGETTTTE